jgi:glutathione S-transferase
VTLLYSFRRCPYAMRARMALLISGVAFDIHEVRLSDKPAALLAASSKGTVPVLVLRDGTVIDESIDIMRWALQRHDPEDWLAGEDAALIAMFDGAFKAHLDGYKYGRDAVANRAAGLAMLQGLEERLVGAANLCGEARAMTDIAIMPFVRQFAMVDRAWFDALPLPRVQDWLARHLSSSLFVQAMAKGQLDSTTKISPS